MTNPVDDAFPINGTGIAGDVRDFMKLRTVLALTSVSEVAGLDLTGQRWLLVGTNRDFFQHDAAWTAAHDGITTLVDAAGNRFIRRSGMVATSLFNFSGSGVPSGGLGVNGDTYYNVANHDIYQKAGGVWGSPVGNISGPAGQPGLSSGLPFTFSTSTAMGDGGTAVLRFNNANASLATAIAVTEEVALAGNPSYIGALASWGAGKISIASADGTALFTADVTGVTSNTTWLQFTVSGAVSSGAFTNGGVVTASFSPRGAQGIQGPAGDAAGRPSWLFVPEINGVPRLPVLQWEPALGLAWLNGTVQAISAISTNHGDGSYTLTTMPTGLEAGVLVYADWEYAGSGTPTGSFVSMSGGSLLESELGLEVEWNSDANVLGLAPILRAATPSIYLPKVSRFGNNRGIVTMPPNGGVPAVQIADGAFFAANVLSSFAAPVTLTIGRRSYPPSPIVLANATVKRVLIFAGTFDAAGFEAVFKATDPLPAPAVPTLPDWLPRIAADDGSLLYPAVLVDDIRARYWQNGAQRSAAQIIENHGVGRRLKRGPKLTAAGGVCAVTDFSPSAGVYTFAQAPAGMLVAGTDTALAPVGGLSRLEVVISTSGSTTPGGLISAVVWLTANSANNGFDGLAPAPLGGGQVLPARGWGINRLAVSCPASGPVLRLWDMAVVASNNPAVSTYGPQDHWKLGANFSDGQPLTNATVEQFMLFGRALSAAELYRLAEWNEYRAQASVAVGDSLNNGAMLTDWLRWLYWSQGRTYLPIWSFAQGGRGLNYFLQYMTQWVTAHPRMKDWKLLLNEGGLDYQGLALDGVTTEGPFSDRQLTIYLQGLIDLFDGIAIIEPHANQAYVQQTRLSAISAQTTAGTACRLATAASITLLSGLLTVDGVASVAGDRILVTIAANPANAGIWIASAGAWTRASDADTAAEFAGKHYAVTAGSTLAGKSFFALPFETMGTQSVVFAERLPVIDSSWVIVRASSTLNVWLYNDGDNAIEWQAAGSLPGGGSTGTWLYPGQKRLIALSAQGLYVRSGRAGDTSLVRVCRDTEVIGDQLVTTLGHIKATWPASWVATTPLLATQAVSDAEYIRNRASGTTPVHLLLDAIHVDDVADGDASGAVNLAEIRNAGTYWRALAVMNWLANNGVNTWKAGKWM